MQQQCARAGGGLVVVLAVAIGVGGCNFGKTSVIRPAPRWQGVTVRVAAPAGSPRLLIDRLGHAWANTVGAKLEIGLPTGEWPAADVVLMPAPDLPRWAAAGKAMPLPQPEAIDVFMPLYRTRLLSWAGTAYALPVLGDGPICIYRRDLYADPANQREFQQKYNRPLNPPETWNEFADQAEFFFVRRARPSLPPVPTNEAGLCAAFEAVAAPFAVSAAVTATEKPDQVRSARPFSFQYDVDSGEPRLAEPGFVEALTLFRRLESYRAKATTAAEAMKSDHVALGYISLTDLAAAGPDEARRWGVFRTPGIKRDPNRDGPGGPVNAVPFVGAGAVVGVVPMGAAKAAAGFDLLGYLSGTTASTEVVHTPAFGGGPFRDMHIDPQHELGWLNYGLDEKQTALLRIYLKEVADPRVDNPALALRIPKRETHIAAMAAAVRAALSGGDPATALKTAADEWRKLDGDPVKARADYRRSVGLKP